ncbi:E3 ubiquitin-protein ligase LRSAM1 isoform X3 [Aethina tumida]|nr:E3 ubiquitin-protein ligase LRSAM1 isoform X3 [Aethina tumida]
MFVTIPEDISLLKDLKELHLGSNKLKLFPEKICSLCSNLQVLDLSDNHLKSLPENMGDLLNLRKLNINGNKYLKKLPKDICRAQRLTIIELDPLNFVYPPDSITSEGTAAIMKYICEDTNRPYISPEDLGEIVIENVVETKGDQTDNFQAKIWKLEHIKQQKMQEFLEIERNNELMQRQELELANSNKVNREKLLADITLQQNKFDSELNRIHRLKETERFRLIEQLQEAEDSADKAIKQLLSVYKEPYAQLLEHEKMEEQRLFNTVTKYETLRKADILDAMEEILQQETEQFIMFNQSRIETSRSILETELESDSKVSEILQNRDLYKAELLSKVREESDLQKAAVGTLLERGDARSWGLLQQVRLVEAQLAALTTFEMDRRKLSMDENLNDLAEKRINLSILLLDLLEKQKQRRSELLLTLQILQERYETNDDFWLHQYQILLDKLPDGLSQAQKNINPILGQALVLNGAMHCLPFLAKFTQCQYDTDNITEEDLKRAGVTNAYDRQNILNAFVTYRKERECVNDYPTPSAPQLPLEEASAPLSENDCVHKVNSECVVCLDLECNVIFFPCGHLCCCSCCSTSLEECPLCRSQIERKIKVISS